MSGIFKNVQDIYQSVKKYSEEPAVHRAMSWVSSQRPLAPRVTSVTSVN